MAHKTNELKFNQGRKWIPGSLGQASEGAPTIDYINEICENNIDNVGCAMALPCGGKNGEHRFKSIHSSWSWELCTANLAIQITLVK